MNAGHASVVEMMTMMQHAAAPTWQWVTCSTPVFREALIVTSSRHGKNLVA
jgi:hypothetical protein